MEREPFVKVPIKLLEATLGHRHELVVWLALASYLNHGVKDGLVWPSQDTLMEKTALCRNTIKKAIKWLIKEDFIQLIHAGRGRGKRTVYFIKGSYGDTYSVKGSARDTFEKVKRVMDETSLLPTSELDKDITLQGQETFTPMSSFNKKPRRWAKEHGAFLLHQINSIPLREDEVQSANGHKQVWDAIKVVLDSADTAKVEAITSKEFWDKVYPKSQWPKKQGTGNAGYGKRVAFVIRGLISSVESEDSAVKRELKKQMERFRK